jgi:hypothetical protein
MARLLIALVIGAILALGATFITSSALLGVANGQPSNSTLYNYGTR